MWVRNLYSFVESIIEDHRVNIFEIVCKVNAYEHRLNGNSTDLKEERKRSAQLVLLAGNEYRISATGIVENVGDYRAPFANYAAFVIRTYAEVTEVKIDFGDNGWRLFKEGLQIRHRLTHPKQLTELEVSDEEVKIVQAGFDWLKATLESCRDGLLRLQEKLKNRKYSPRKTR